MDIIVIKKTIYVQDEYGVSRQVWMEGQEVRLSTYKAVLKTNTVINPEDLPRIEDIVEDTPSVSTYTMETKELPIEVAEPLEDVVENTPVVTAKSKVQRRKKK